MLTIRLQRIGRKHQPGYRIVVVERRSKLGGPPVEDLGFYDPFSKRVGLDKDRVLHWIKIGAQPTDTVHNLCVKEKVFEAPKRAVKIKKKKTEESSPAEASVSAEASVEQGSAPAVAPASATQDASVPAAPAAKA